MPVVWMVMAGPPLRRAWPLVRSPQPTARPEQTNTRTATPPELLHRVMVSSYLRPPGQNRLSETPDWASALKDHGRSGTGARRARVPQLWDRPYTPGRDGYG